MRETVTAYRRTTLKILQSERGGTVTELILIAIVIVLLFTSFVSLLGHQFIPGLVFFLVGFFFYPVTKAVMRKFQAA